MRVEPVLQTLTPDVTIKKPTYTYSRASTSKTSLFRPEVLYQVFSDSHAEQKIYITICNSICKTFLFCNVGKRARRYGRKSFAAWRKGITPYFFFTNYF